MSLPADPPLTPPEEIVRCMSANDALQAQVQSLMERSPSPVRRALYNAFVKLQEADQELTSAYKRSTHDPLGR